MNVKGSKILITGASGKLASKIAVYLARAGADLICHYNRNKAKAEELVSQIESAGSKAAAIASDLSSPDGIENLFEQISELGKCDVLINSASIFQRIPLTELDFAQGRRMLDINFISPLIVCKNFVETFGQGKIINISDVAATKPWADYSLYCASKAALVAATKSLAKELAPNFTVNAVGPGLIDFAPDMSDDEKKRQLKMIPAGRAGTGNEVASAVKYLIENDYVTGSVINVDGGRSL